MLRGIIFSTAGVPVAVPQAATTHSFAAEIIGSGLLHRQPTSLGAQPIADTALVIQVTCVFLLMC